MEAYAKQQAEGFAEWINKNFYYQDENGKWYKSEYDDAITDTTSELYNKYLETTK